MNESSIKKEPSRHGFGRGLVEAARMHSNVVGLCADLTESTRMKEFKDEFPHRFFEIGVAEQNMAAVASGLAASGFIPVIASYAMFSPGRNWEQIRTTICYNNQPVIIAGHHTGLSVGPDGGSHQALEDIALMRVLPNMRVVSPCDSVEATQLMKLLVQNPKPSYIRLARSETEILTEASDAVDLASNNILYQSSGTAEVLIISTGVIGVEAKYAAEQLAQQGIGVTLLNARILKPFPTEQLQFLLEQLGVTTIVTIEEHQKNGGIGSIIAELIADHGWSQKLLRIGVDDQFGQSGTVEELYKAYGLDRDSLVEKIKKFIS